MPIENSNFPQWESWLRHNAELHYIEGKVRYAWREVANAHDPDKRLAKQIATFYEGLPSEQKELFRDGLVKCLQTLPQQVKYLQIFDSFIQLSIECDCYKIIESNFFEKMVFHGKLGYLNAEISRFDNIAHSHCIFLTIISALRYFSRFGDGKRIVDLAKRMARSRYFPNKHLYQLFLILCKAQPNNLFSNWKIIRKKHFEFSKKLKASNRDSTSYPNLRKELRNILDLADIVHFSLEIKSLNDYCLEDEWLLHVLYNKNNGPLNMEIRYGSIYYYIDQKDKIEVGYIENWAPSLSRNFYDIVFKKIFDSMLNVDIHKSKEYSYNEILAAFHESEFDPPLIKDDEVDEINIKNQKLICVA